MYISRKLFPQERNYLVIEKEALDIMWAVDTLTYYLLGAPFVLIIDHGPLKMAEQYEEPHIQIDVMVPHPPAVCIHCQTLSR